MELTQREILEGNQLIGEFMPNWDGRFYHIANKGKYHKLQLEFHSSWDWLIPVVDKITSMNEYFKYINATSSQFDDGHIKINTRFIIETWKQVIDFIKWYNQTQN